MQISLPRGLLSHIGSKEKSLILISYFRLSGNGSRFKTYVIETAFRIRKYLLRIRIRRSVILNSRIQIRGSIVLSLRIRIHEFVILTLRISGSGRPTYNESGRNRIPIAINKSLKFFDHLFKSLKKIVRLRFQWGQLITDLPDPEHLQDADILILNVRYRSAPERAGVLRLIFVGG
jgi:hypothetical protein